MMDFSGPEYMNRRVNDSKSFSIYVEGTCDHIKIAIPKQDYLHIPVDWRVICQKLADFSVKYSKSSHDKVVSVV